MTLRQTIPICQAAHPRRVAVLNYDVTEPYRPEALRDHTEFARRPEP